MNTRAIKDLHNDWYLKILLKLDEPLQWSNFSQSYDKLSKTKQSCPYGLNKNHLLLSCSFLISITMITPRFRVGTTARKFQIDT